MEIIAVPTEVYAYVYGGWRRILGINREHLAVALDIDGMVKIFAGKDSFGWDLLWP